MPTPTAPAGDAPADASVAVGVVEALARHGSRPALLSAGTTTTYAELARRVQTVADRLGGTRRLVLLAMDASLDAVTTYLAALAGGHPLLVVEDRDSTVAALVAAYDPDVVARPGTDLLEVRTGTSHDLHPDLALLLSTSGSTGSPKLVRLSRDNLRANTLAIADVLGVRPDDRAVTSLPLHYCYGLSVLNTHLLRGASVVLTGRSVAEPEFWDLMRTRRVTSLAGVPHTFDLLDAVGFAGRHLPHLRLVTQAGGRLAPDRVRRYAELGRERGWDLVVMYGQTEATARMACLPPERALTHPHTVGVPVPGGAFRLRAVAGAPLGTGELVYTGPNVMLGYAERPGDLALGRTVTELATGDLARQTADGFWEVVGRRARVAKLFGLRVDLDHVEARLADDGWSAVVVEDGQRLHVAVAAPGDPDVVRRRVAETAGLPTAAVRAVPVARLPLLPSGKPDRAAVQASIVDVPPPTAHPGLLDALVAAYAVALDAPHTGPDDTFAGLGGDSLTYVEVTLRLEELLGELPTGWHLMTLRQLAAPATPGSVARERRPGGRSVDVSVFLRAVAIVLIAASHAEVVDSRGGAHVLLALAGYNVARFQLTGAPAAQRARALLRSAGRIAVPSVVIISLTLLVTDRYLPANAALVHGFLGPDAFADSWAFWFVEVLVWTVLGAALLARVPLLHRVERAAPFGTAVAVLGVGLAFRYELVDLGTGPDRIHTLQYVLWLFALGWAAARASTVVQRRALSIVAVVATAGWFTTAPRTIIVIAGLLLLIWCRTVRVPRATVAPLGLLATSSLYIYLTHFQVYREFASPAAGLVASLVVGIAVARVAGALPAAWRRVGVRRPLGTLAPPRPRSSGDRASVS